MAAQPLASTTLVARRPIVITVAMVMLVLMALFTLVPAPGTEEMPRFILISGYILAALKVIAAVGLWRCYKWAAILGFVAVFLDALTAVPGLIFAPNSPLQVLVAVWLVLSAVLLILLTRPAARQAYH